ncbi:hypothetical protein PWT90_10527 [Aphanocladium album]|nr:hypothetical protein PWT90_10527 [Aphanocladium album]
MKLLSLTTLLAIVLPAVADLLPHAGIPDGQFNYWKMADALRSQLKFPNGYGHMANEFGLNPNDFSVFNVDYADCETAWVFCKHKDSAADENNMLEMFGRAPVGMRQFVRHLVGLPSYVSQWSAQTTPDGDIRFLTHIDMPILLHEMSHSMDWHALSGYGDTFSSSGIWSNTYYRDSYTPSEYGRNNWMEDFAEAGKCGVADANLYGGFGSVTSWWTTIQNQYKTYEQYFGSFIKQGGSCTRRFSNSAPVPMNGKRAVGPKPEDPSSHSTIAIIEPKPHLAGQITTCQNKKPEEN